MESFSNNPGSQQELRLPSLLSSPDVSSDDRLAHVRQQPSFPVPAPPPSTSTPWCSENPNHRGADLTSTTFTGSPLLLPPRGWPGTEVTIYLPSPLRCDAARQVELAFGRSRVSAHLDPFRDPNSNNVIVHLMAYAPPISYSSSSSSNQHGSTRPSLPPAVDEEYTVQVTLYLVEDEKVQSNYAVGTFTYLPTAVPVTIPRPIPAPATLPPWSLHSSSYKDLVAYQVPSFLRQHHSIFGNHSGSSSNSSIDYEGYPLVMTTAGPCIFAPQYGIYNINSGVPVVEYHMADTDAAEPLSATRSHSKPSSKTRKSTRRRATATRRPRPSSTAVLDPSASVALYHPYPSVTHHVDFKLLGETDRLVDGWSDKEVDQGRRVVRFWRADDDDVRSPVVRCAFEVVDDEDDLQQWCIQQQEQKMPLECASGEPSSFPPSMLVSCIRWNGEYYVTSVDLIALIELLVHIRFDVAGKNRIRRNLEGFRPVTASKYNAQTVGLYQLIMGFAAPKPRNIEKDIKVFYWKTLPYALKKLVIKHCAPPSTHGVIRAQPVPDTTSLQQQQQQQPPTETTDAAVAVARHDEEVQRLLRHRDPSSPETPPATPITPNDGHSFAYDRFDD